MSKLKFKILKKIWNARVGEINLNWVRLTTPIFMPVGTKATIKGLILDMLQDPKYIWDLPIINLILANTFHLYLRPWDQLIKDAWWLHKFENWNWLILTDSWWFQIFSLWLNQNSRGDYQATDEEKEFSHEVKIKLTEEWVKFNSPYDWSKHFFTPESVVDIQCNLWSDIMMVLDVCSPTDCDKATIEKQMQMTHRWAKRAFDHLEKKYDKVRWVLFPIVQWWIHTDLREQSIDFLSQYARDWIAVWWVSVGESKELIREIVEFTWPRLPDGKPRYLMWVGTPEDISHAIENWFDMFDCVLATRLGRHGMAFSDDGNLTIKNAKYKSDFSPLKDNCPCFVCRNYTKAYLHHLIKEKEMLGGILLSFHNIVYLNSILEKWKKEKLWISWDT